MHKDRLERGFNYITLHVFMNLQSSLDELELNVGLVSKQVFIFSIQKLESLLKGTRTMFRGLFQ